MDGKQELMSRAIDWFMLARRPGVSFPRAYERASWRCLLAWAGAPVFEEQASGD